MTLAAQHISARSNWRAAALVLGVAVCGALPVAAQTVDCNRLSAQIAAMGQGGGGGSARYEAAAARQRAELGRTTSYARQLGCDRQNFLFFGPPRPPQCDGLNAQIQRMQTNLGQLQQMGGGDGNARRSLQAQFAAYCGANRSRGFFDDLFNGPQRRPALEDELPPPVDEQQRAEERDSPRGGPLAVCVRSCDGGFFPVSYSARRGSLSDLQELCTALCPNTEAKIYTRSLARDMKTAVSLDGEAYTEHPNAFKFEKAFDKSCACKAQGATWADTLADAERVLGAGRKTDIIVTPEKAEELSRAQPATGKRAKFDPAATAKALEAKPAPDVIDSATIIEDAMSAQAPTASKDSAGIATTPATTATVQKRAEGEMKTVTDADGATKKVRVIAPRL